MSERGFASVYLRQEVGGVGGVEGAQLAVSLLRFVYFISVQVKKAQLCQSINVARPDINSFLVRSLGGFPLLLLVKIVLQFVVCSDGRVSDVTSEESLPFGLTEQAIDALKKLRFQPALLGTQPVSVMTKQTFVCAQQVCTALSP